MQSSTYIYRVFIALCTTLASIHLSGADLKVKITKLCVARCRAVEMCGHNHYIPPTLPPWAQSKPFSLPPHLHKHLSLSVYNVPLEQPPKGREIPGFTQHKGGGDTNPSQTAHNRHRKNS